MLTPEDIRELKPQLEEIYHHLDSALQFEEIHRHLDSATTKSDSEGISDEACGYYIAALALMEDLVEVVNQKDGHGIKGALKWVVDSAKSPEGAGVAGGLGAGAWMLSFTNLGGFGLAAGGTAVGMSGLAGATVATGGASLAGAAALYLAYKGGAAALETEPAQKLVDQAAAAGKKTAAQATSVGKKAAEGLNKMRNLRIRIESQEDGPSES